MQTTFIHPQNFKEQTEKSARTELWFWTNQVEPKSESIHSTEIIWKQSKLTETWMVFNADFFSWFNLRLYIFIPKHKQKLLHAFSRITVRLTGRKPVMLAAEANEDTWRLFCGSLICFSVASFSDAFNKTQHFLCDKSTFQIPKLNSTHRVQQSERQRSEWTANDSFLRLLFASKLNSSCYTEHVQPRQIYA